MKDRRAVLFDFDGVLVDTFELHFAAWREAGATKGIELDREFFARRFGWTNRAIARDLLDADDAVLDEIALIKENRFSTLADSVVYVSGAEMLLADLREAAFGLALVTATPRASLSTVSERLKLSSRFDLIVTGDDVSRGKPDPAAYELAAARLGVEHPRCIVVDDSAAAVAAAVGKRMKGVWINDTNNANNAAALTVPAVGGLTAELLLGLLEPAASRADYESAGGTHHL